MRYIFLLLVIVLIKDLKADEHSKGHRQFMRQTIKVPLLPEINIGKGGKQSTTITTTTTTTTEPTTTTTTTTEPTTTEKSQKCEAGVTLINGQPVCKGQIIFEENFINLDHKVWKPEVKIAYKPDYEFCTYVNFPENLQVKNGNLYIKPTLTIDRYGESFLNGEINLGKNCTGTPGTQQCSKVAQTYQILPPILSGRISTKEHFTFKYGKVEIRAKVPKGKWIYPIIALRPKNSEYGRFYDSGEIQIVFVPGNDNLGKDLSGGVILSSSEEGRTYGMRYYQGEEHWGSAYHTYGLKWKPNSITVTVDGSEYGTIVPPEGGFASEAENLKSMAGERWKEGSPMAPFDTDMYLTLGVGIGGQSFSDLLPGGKPWKNTDPKNMLKFWQDRNNWHSTWNDSSSLRIDYVKIISY